jgi:protein-L-isoaspartate(D-aspartate) O-methyltransferase
MTAAERRNELVDRLSKRENLAPATEAAMRAVPRHEFIPASKHQSAYQDSPLPIGEGQTISAPHMVAIMTDLLELQEGDDVLEIGTGCGYHAAVTAEIVGADHVYSVEYHDNLAQQARENLEATGYGEVAIRAGDGKKGWPEHAPYDHAYLTCAAPDFPESVREQVKTGGTLLAPIGNGTQVLIRAIKHADGELSRERHGHVRFVPLQ